MKTNSPTQPQTLAAIQAMRSENASTARVADAKLQAEADAVFAIQHPLNELLQERQQMRERLNDAADNRARNVEWAGQFEKLAAYLIFRQCGIPDAEGLVIPKHVLFADKMICAIDRAVELKKLELAALEKQIAQYAKTHQIEYLLTAEV